MLWITMKKLPLWARRSLKFFISFILVFIFAVTLTVLFSGDDDYQGSLDENVVNDITQLNPIHVTRVIKPQNVSDIVEAINTTSGPISIGGGRYSMGGQTAIENSLHLDMRNYNKVIAFSKDNREITVESGITWHMIQEYIDKHDLAIQIMQTYANFTVGGSMSVNVHGRYIGHGPLISSIKSFSIVLADGSVKQASPTLNPELYYSAIGGYGGIGVITEVTLKLATNEKVERKTTTLEAKDYKKHFFTNIRDNKNVVFHNADLYPPDYDTLRDVSWYVTDKDVTIDERLIPTDREYTLLPRLIPVVSSMPFGKALREHVIDPLYYSEERIAWRNWEASYDVRELGEGDRKSKTYVLNEYFIPVNNIDSFIPKMREVFQKHNVDVINVSIRHALPDPGSYLAWAREEVFAFVVYYRQGTTEEDKKQVAQWTREMTDQILSENGAYYLPYQPHATLEQFKKAYPQADKYFAIKKKVDPNNRFQNKLWEKYYPSKEKQVRNELDQVKNYYKGEEQTYLTLPEWYLVFNPNEYADFLQRGENPSDFPFFKSIDEYWRLYDRVNTLTHDVYPENSEYLTMLQVIGVSTTAEYMLKGIYENTVGRFTHWTASADTPEDLLIQQAHAAYGKLIYDKAWYHFPFWSWAKRIWSEPSFFGKNFIRKLERKFAFTLEFTFKALYAKLIGFGAQTAYEASDGLVTLLVKADPQQLLALDPRIKLLKDMGDHKLIITLPRWGDFTQIMPKLAEANVHFIEISGNDDILVSAISQNPERPDIANARFLFSSIVMSPANQERQIYSVNVSYLSDFLRTLKMNGLELEHIYDF